MVSFSISLMTSGTEHFFLLLLTICLSSLRNVYLLAHLLVGLLGFSAAELFWFHVILELVVFDVIFLEQETAA